MRSRHSYAGIRVELEALIGSDVEKWASQPTCYTARARYFVYFGTIDKDESRLIAVIPSM